MYSKFINTHRMLSIFESCQKKDVASLEDLERATGLKIRHVKETLYRMRTFGLSIEYDRKKKGWQILEGEEVFLQSVAEDMASELPTSIYPYLKKCLKAEKRLPNTTK